MSQAWTRAMQEWSHRGADGATECPQETSRTRDILPRRRHRITLADSTDNSSGRSAGRRRRDTRPEHAGLVRQLRADRDTFSQLYEAHFDGVYRYLLSRTGNPADAEELTSRTFLNALQRLDQYRGTGGFRSWLMSIAHNLLANWHRDRGRRPRLAVLADADDVRSDAPGPEASIEGHERIEYVRSAVNTLAPERQQLIELKYVDGLSNAEIGRIMGRSVGAVKALHHRTLRELQRRLSSEVVD
jgi:RNA polymerase sigma-70 factor (ECF subfamily)